MTTCECGRPVNDGYVCTGCADTARDALHRVVEGLDVDLTVTLAKQGDTGIGGQQGPSQKVAKVGTHKGQAF